MRAGRGKRDISLTALACAMRGLQRFEFRQPVGAHKAPARDVFERCAFAHNGGGRGQHHKGKEVDGQENTHRGRMPGRVLSVQPSA
jgi:hypothetical protein